MLYDPITRRQSFGFGAALMAVLPSASGKPRFAPRKLLAPETALGPIVNNRITLGKTLIDLDDATLLWQLSNVTVTGAAGGTTITTRSPEALLFLDASNCVFENIAFRTTAAGRNMPRGGLISTYHRTLRNLRFLGCSFDCSNAGTNAVKLVFERGNAQGESIHFVDCTIKGAGRMGLEVQNNVNDGVQRYQDIRWVGGGVLNTGLVYDREGQGISFTGLGSDCTVDTRFHNNGYVSFENVGGSFVHLSGRASGLTRNASPIALSNSLPMFNGSISNFECLDTCTADILIGNQRGLTLQDNHFRTTGRVRFIGAQNCVSRRETYEVGSPIGLLVAQNKVEGISRNNVWEDLTIISHAPAASAAASVVRFAGPDIQGNRLTRLRTNGRAAVAADIAQFNGAAGNGLTS